MQLKSVTRYIVSFFFLTLMGCANTTEKSLQEITVGMDKAMVLDIIGDPYSTDRSNSVDEWLYPYYFDGIQKYKKVYFKFGKVTEVRNYEPSDEDLPPSYEDYEKRVKSRQKEKKGEFKDIKN